MKKKGSRTVFRPGHALIDELVAVPQYTKASHC